MKLKKTLVLLVILFLAAVLPLFGDSESTGREEPSMTHLMTVLVLQLAVIIIAAKLVGYLFSRYLKQSRVLGELAAGMIIGPFALGSIPIPWLHGPLFPIPAGPLPISPQLYGFAIVASIVLLFLAGLETDLPTFLRYSGKASIIGLGGVVLSFFFGDMIAVLLLPKVASFMDPTALFLGTLSTATSVGITARILSEKRKMSSPEGVTILAAAVLDDVLGIIFLAVVVGLAKVSTTGGAIPWGRIGVITAKAFGFWIACTVIGILVAPRLTKGLKRFGSMDIVASISFGIGLFLAGLSEMAGLAMIIGAYVTGLALSQTDIAHELRERLQGVYAFFVPVFFCVMGMMVNFPSIRTVLLFGLIYTGVAILGKVLGCGLPALLAGFNLRGAFRVSTGMLPRGEVTLIVAGIGLTAGVIGSDMFGVAIMTLLVSSVISPPLLVKSFSGGSGLRRKEAVAQEETLSHQIKLEFPTVRMTEYIAAEIIEAFKKEEFFIHRIDSRRKIYHIRKEDITITLTQEETVIEINTAAENEQLVKLLMLEALLELQDFLEGLQNMKSPDTMGADLLSGLFSSEDDTEKKKG
jgi:Kef-type K+ transport system membrane component KefB